METKNNEKNDESSNNFPDIDLNSSDFHDKVQTELEFDLARMKKSIDMVMELRLVAAELEVETASLYHAELWHQMFKLQQLASDKYDQVDEEDDFLEMDTDPVLEKSSEN